MAGCQDAAPATCQQNTRRAKTPRPEPTYYPGLDIVYDQESRVGMSGIRQTDQQALNGGYDRRGAFVAAAIATGQLRVKP